MIIHPTPKHQLSTVYIPASTSVTTACQHNLAICEISKKVLLSPVSHMDAVCWTSKKMSLCVLLSIGDAAVYFYPARFQRDRFYHICLTAVVTLLIETTHV